MHLKLSLPWMTDLLSNCIPQNTSFGVNGCIYQSQSNPDEFNTEFGSLIFLDEALKFKNRVDLAEGLQSDYPSAIHGTMFKAQDGNIVTGFSALNPSESRELLIIKTDQEGNEIWRYLDPRGAIVSLSETSEGGILVGMRTNDSLYSSTSWLLIKLTSDGKLN